MLSKKNFIISIFILLIIIFCFFKNGPSNLNILLLSFALNVSLMPFFIDFLKKMNPSGQPIREDGPTSHLQNKKGTQTGGGIFLIFFTICTSLIFCDFKIIWPIYLTLILFISLGIYDDYLKISKSNSKGISEISKFMMQFFFGTIISFLIYKQFPYVSKIYIPFFGMIFDLGIWFIPFGIFIIIASSNALNLTDGLDGLAITQFISIACFFLLTLFGFGKISQFLIEYKLNQEMIKFLFIILGSSFAFLFYNTFPARIFMGDSGSLALGALIGSLSLIFLMPLMLGIFGFIIVIEVLSVIIQVGYFKYTKKKTGAGKRIFLMTPIHHHFEKKNIHENSITIRMFLISIFIIIFALQI